MEKNWSANYSLNFGDKIIYGLIYGITVSISLLPFWVLYRISDFFCLLIRVIGYRKNIIEKNIKNSFPEKSDSEVKKIRNDFYSFFCDYIFETIKLATISQKELLKRMNYKGLENISKAIDEDRMVALYLGHYCNWEWITSLGLLTPEKSHPSQIYHILESKVMDKLMLKLRSRMGNESVPRSESLRRIISIKKEGEVPIVGFISDQAPIINSMPYWIDFLNQSTPFIDGTERLIKKLNMLPIYLDISRIKRGYYEIDITVLTNGNLGNLKDGEITELYAKALEKTIKRQPQFWLWSHNRWKRRPEEFIKKTKSVD